MRILITNDDGINAPGLKVLEKIAHSLAGPDGEVWTVAPAFEQSGVAHAISYTHPMLIAKLDERRYATEGSPADCVLAALHDVLPAPPDLVLSGINRGNNAGENTLYSGTVGGAMEAALQGLPAIAISQYLGPGNRKLADPFEAAAAHGEEVLRKLLQAGHWDESDYRLFYNVNFPPVPAAGVKGYRIATQGYRRDCYFGVEPHVSPSGRRFLWIRGGPQDLPAGPQSDVSLALEGYVAITPMRCDLTAHEVVGQLREAIE